MKAMNRGRTAFLVVVAAGGIAAVPTGAPASPAKAKLIIDSPRRGETPEPTVGLDAAVVVKWRAENFQIASPGRAERSPGSKEPASTRKEEKATAPSEGHLHVSIDNSPWFLVHSSADPVVAAGFSPGPHTITLELVGLEHESLSPPEKATINFTVGGN